MKTLYTHTHTHTTYYVVFPAFWHQTIIIITAVTVAIVAAVVERKSSRQKDGSLSWSSTIEITVFSSSPAESTHTLSGLLFSHLFALYKCSYIRKPITFPQDPWDHQSFLLAQRGMEKGTGTLRVKFCYLKRRKKKRFQNVGRRVCVTHCECVTDWKWMASSVSRQRSTRSCFHKSDAYRLTPFCLHHCLCTLCCHRWWWWRLGQSIKYICWAVIVLHLKRHTLTQKKGSSEEEETTAEGKLL